LLVSGPVVSNTPVLVTVKLVNVLKAWSSPGDLPWKATVAAVPVEGTAKPLNA